ncbi:hypothetical protein CH289_14215 [Rhodococcus sp. RS1C4]|uniref:lipase family protein n=1 Tax=Rhodococcus sp. 14-2470-1a TaxID=2023150 RepID=UPI000377561A|nr:MULTISPECIES: lipase family protein [unclassified Rhodococcus (in: high G+C Gram-positive bacteria)]OZC48327.1 hypothetical protein CH267_25800 [Rhodococcus sp. 06-621-2]OZC51784.1 hypothetical protein CH289_14215 [Rhodococcus sp. RS1C4]OZF54373.1 hypothetical protein CH292_07485 [Rhodococcus sp. 14-2470-1a]
MFGSRAPRFLPAKPTVGPKASAAALAVCATLAAACSTTSAQPHAPSPAHSAAQPPAYSTSIPTATAETVAARGTVVSSSTTTPFDPALFPAGTTAATVVYNSVSGVDGSPTQVSGAVFVPDGPAPVGGRPIVAYAHGTVGISPGCAPSEKRDLAGDADVVSRFLERGYAVAYTDYQGLSSTVDSPPHPYLEPRTAAFDVIDSVRAARNLDPRLSTRWVAVGWSQGGQAAWAANEFDDVYGDGLDLRGAAVLSPALDISPGIIEAQSSGTSGEADGQRAVYPLIVEGAARVDPSIDPADHLHGALAGNLDQLVGCNAASSEAQAAAAADVQPGDTTASTPAAAEQLTRRMQEYSLPRAASPAPILAVYGSEDTVVKPAWTESALGRACSLGDTLLAVRLEGQGHDVDPGTLVETWVDDRFTGGPAPSNC